MRSPLAWWECERLSAKQLLGWGVVGYAAVPRQHDGGGDRGLGGKLPRWHCRGAVHLGEDSHGGWLHRLDSRMEVI